MKLAPDICSTDMRTGEEAEKNPGWLRIILIGRSPTRTLIRIVVLIVVVFAARTYALLPIKVRGPSMLPTYQDHGVNFVNRLAYVRADPQRGDVVAIKLAGTSVMFMKRIIGLPGETVEFRYGRVFIDGKVLEEPYMNFTSFPCTWNISPEKLGSDQYYVVGDNRTMPEEYHEKGATYRRRIVGRILLCKNLFASSSRRP
jgi:signal peptidase I